MAIVAEFAVPYAGHQREFCRFRDRNTLRVDPEEKVSAMLTGIDWARNLPPEYARQRYILTILLLTCFASGHSKGTADWLAHFAGALCDLDNGVVPPEFAPAPRKSRRPEERSRIWIGRALIASGMTAYGFRDVARGD